LAIRRLEDVPRREQWDRHHEGGRAALRDVLGHHGVEAAVTVDPEHGYLCLLDDAGCRLPWFANVSHTAGLAVAVLASSPVGVDVERVDRDPTRAVARFLSRRDRERLARFCPHDVTGELVLWTGKEASLGITRRHS